MISYDEFKKVEIKAGKILSAEKIPDTDKLLKLSVDFGEFEEIKDSPAIPDVLIGVDFAKKEEEKIKTDSKDNTIVEKDQPEVITTKKIPKPRQIVSGISHYFPDPSVLVGKTCMFVTNLEPRNIKGFESNGMLFAVSTKEGGFSLLEPNSSIPPGTQAA
jgi:tRNA-binding EMAP/Myf-like protein